jgi:iron(III) transport system ATP-binding protein
MAELRIHNLNKHYEGSAVLRGIDLTVASGKLVAILGPSGSGKTTLLRLICGFERPDSGSIHLRGAAVSDGARHLPPEQRHIGYVPQEGGLFPHLSVAENIVFGLARSERKRQHRVAELLELVGLPPALATRAPQALSGGQQQRVALARALAPSPALILFDEPFSSLDAGLRIETRQAVAAALAASGATALLVTHDQSEALSMGDQVAVLWQGKLIQVASPQTLYRHPVSADLAGFIGDAVLLPGNARPGSVSCALGQLALAPGMPQGEVEVLLRPEQIRLTALGAQDEASGPCGQVVDIQYYGHDSCVRLRLNSAPATLLTARAPGQAGLSIGAQVAIMVEGEVVTYRTCAPVLQP